MKIKTVSGMYRAPGTDGKLFTNGYENVTKTNFVSEKQLFVIDDINKFT